jgi:hypothetical protein
VEACCSLEDAITGFKISDVVQANPSLGMHPFSIVLTLTSLQLRLAEIIFVAPMLRSIARTNVPEDLVFGYFRTQLRQQ